jgi:hypothetical protein
MSGMNGVKSASKLRFSLDFHDALEYHESILFGKGMT